MLASTSIERNAVPALRTALFLPSLLVLAACAGSPIRLGDPQESCSPGISGRNEYGAVAVQQKEAGSGIAWGVTPSRSNTAVRYVVDTYTDKRRREHKDQARAPHGYIPPSQVRSGGRFSLSGTAYDAKGNTQALYIVCKMA